MAPPATEYQQLAELVRLREQFLSNQVVAGQQKENAPKALAPVLRQSVAFAGHQIAAVEKQIDRCLTDNASLRRDSELVESIPGIGRLTTATVLAIMPLIRQLDNARQLAAFAGVNPRQNQSGTRRGASRLCKLRHGRLRKALYFPATVAMRNNAKVRGLSQRLAKKGKAKMSIIGACMQQVAALGLWSIESPSTF